jgi:hypothetical protein
MGFPRSRSGGHDLGRTSMFPSFTIMDTKYDVTCGYLVYPLLIQLLAYFRVTGTPDIVITDLIPLTYPVHY